MPQSMSGGNIIQMRNPWEGLGDSVNAAMSDRMNREATIARQRLEFLERTARDMDAVEPGSGRAFLADQAAEIQAAQRQLLNTSRGFGAFLPSAAADAQAKNMAGDVAASINSNPAIPYLAATGIRRGPGYAQTQAAPGAPPAAGAGPIEGAPAPATPAEGYVSPWGDYSSLLNRGMPLGALGDAGLSSRMPYGMGQGFGVPSAEDVRDADAAFGPTGAWTDPAVTQRWRDANPMPDGGGPAGAEFKSLVALSKKKMIDDGYPPEHAERLAQDYARRALAANAVSEALYVKQLTPEDRKTRKQLFYEGAGIAAGPEETYEAEVARVTKENLLKFGNEAQARAYAESFVTKQRQNAAYLGTPRDPKASKIPQEKIDKSFDELFASIEALGSDKQMIPSRSKEGVTRKAYVAPAPRAKAYIQYGDNFMKAALAAGVDPAEAEKQLYTGKEAREALEAIRGGTYQDSFVEKALLPPQEQEPLGFEGEGQAFLRAAAGRLQFQPDATPPPAGVRPPQAGPTSLAPEAGGSSLTGYTGDIRPLPGSEMAAGNGITMQSDVPRPLPTTSAPRFGTEMQGQTSVMADRFKAGLPSTPETPAPATFADKRVQVLGEQAAETLSVSPGSATGKLINGEALSFEELQKVYRGLDDAAAFAGAIDQRGRMSSRETWEKAFREGTPDERRAAFQLLNENTDMISTENLALLSPAAAQARIQERIAMVDERRLAAIGKDDTALKVYEKQQEGLWKLVAAADEVNKSYGKLLETKDGTKNAAQFLNDTKGIREAGKRAQEVLSGMKLPATIVTELDPAWYARSRRRFQTFVEPAGGAATQSTSVGGFSGDQTTNAYLNNSKAPGGR